VTTGANATGTTSGVVTATGTTVPETTSDEGATAPADGTDEASTGSDASSGSPGFGVLAVVVAALAGVVALARRRR
jgi:PGF-CTERM protein